MKDFTHYYRILVLLLFCLKGLGHVRFCFDESGDLGDRPPSERYFVIGGFYSGDAKRMATVTRRAIGEIRKHHPFLATKPEIKAKDCSIVDKDYVLSKLAHEPDINIVYIVTDKKYVPPGYRLGKVQNLFYNYQLGLLVAYTLRQLTTKPSISHYLIDERSIQTGSLNSFQDYMNIKLNYVQKITIDFQVSYGLSHNYPEIQASDFICNAIWIKENYPKTIIFMIL